MKKTRMFALALVFALALPLLLTACSKEEPKPSSEIDAGIMPGPSGGGMMLIPVPTPTPTPDDEETGEPTQSPEAADPGESVNTSEPANSPTAEVPVATPEITPGSEPTATPTATPAATPAPTPEATPEPPPAPTPDHGPGAAAPALTAAQIYSKVSAAATGTYMIDTSYVLDAFYPDLSEADFEDFVLYMPDASGKIEEILIGKVAPGRMDAVKAACQSRLQEIKADATQYAETGDYVDSYRLVVKGDWILFLVAENAAAGETAFNDYLK